MIIADKFSHWMFSAPQGKRSALAILLWWELRRIPYNLIVGIPAFLALVLFYFFISRANVLEPGDDAVEPIALLAAPVALNVCYTAGWLIETFANNAHSKDDEAVGPKLLKFGIKLSLFLAIVPAVYWGGYWLLQVIGSVK